jgi:predicted NAD-dependent protein-ADP-ribosyltransferase YbiA (DUF1768 family)
MPKTPLIIDSFEGVYDFLCNFYPHRVFYENHWYPRNEHAFHAMKEFDPFYRVKFQTKEEMKKFYINHNQSLDRSIKELPPWTAKKLGRSATLRKDWEEVKVQIMTDINRIKFSDPLLRKKLLDTGDAILIEGNDWNDKFWGVCDGVGENMLGRILVKIRSEIKENMNETI